MTALFLAALALLLAGPVPAVLAGVPRLRRTPASALVLWQAVALAGVLSAVGAGLSLVLDPTWRTAPGATVAAALALLVTVLVAGRLLVSGHRVGVELRALRRRHRVQLELVGRRDPDGLRVLDHPIPVAYCLPGMAGSRVVVSSGALARLAPDQLAATLAHERAHLRARHDLVLEAFTVLRHAFPALPSAGAALAEVGLLVEVLADRAAVRAGQARALGGALLALAEGRLPAGSLGAGTGHLVVRVELLADTRRHRLQAAVLLAASGGVLLTPTLLVVGPWMADTLL